MWADKEDTKTEGLQSNMTKIMRGKHGQKWHDLHLSFSLFFFIQIQSNLNASHTPQTNILEYLCCPYTHRHSMKTDWACRNMSCHHVLLLKMRKVVYIDTTWCPFFFFSFLFPDCSVLTRSAHRSQWQLFASSSSVSVSIYQHPRESRGNLWIKWLP